MKLFIPTIGTQLVLSKDWKFSVYSERRNQDLGIILGLYQKNTQPYCYWGKWKNQSDERRSFLDVVLSGTCELPPKTILKIDRIYIRRGFKGFDSVSFRIVSCPDAKFNKIRFWAKLDDVNNIEYKN